MPTIEQRIEALAEQIVKAKGNPCHTPSGPEGGQFCETAGSVAGPPRRNSLKDGNPMDDKERLRVVMEDWDDDRTATAISKASEKLVKSGSASGEYGKHAEVLLTALGETKVESNDLYRGLSRYDLKQIGDVKEGGTFGIVGLKSFTSDEDVAHSFAAGSRKITVLRLEGNSRTLDLPDASVAGGERITNGTFKVTKISVDERWSDMLDQDAIIKTITVSQVGIYGKK